MNFKLKFWTNVLVLEYIEKKCTHTCTRLFYVLVLEYIQLYSAPTLVTLV